MSFPHVAIMQVVSRSMNPWGVYCTLPSVQGTGTLIRMGFHGSADTLRVSQKALPTEGTLGVVLFPYGDSRNGVWMCSIYTQQNDALPGSDLDMDYEAHPSGAWHAIDGQGVASLYLPDGSFMTTNPGGALPALTRHVVQENQVQVPQVYPNATRAQGTPAPRPLTISLAAGQTVTFNIDGSITVTPKLGMPVTIDGDLRVTGNIYSGYGGTDQIELSQHVHSQPPDSHGDTEANTSPPIAGT